MPGKRELLAGGLRYSGVGAALRAVGSWRGLLVLNYHRIGRPDGSLFDWDLWSASEEQFADQVRHLTRHCDVVGVRDLADVARRPGRYVMITFDDGYADNYEAAFPILRAYGATATFFITTGFLDGRRLAWWDEIAWMVRTSPRPGLAANPWTDTPVPFDDPTRQPAVARLLAVYKSLPTDRTGRYLDFLAESTGSGRCPQEAANSLWMTWEMVRELDAAGMSIGGHTVQHPVLARLPAAEQAAEIHGCRERLAEVLGKPVSAFSYPVGQRDSFTAETRDALQEAGFTWAFSYYGGCGPLPLADPLNIPRTAVEQHTTPTLFRALTSLPQLFA